jgi:carboxylate-amine ligase
VGIEDPDLRIELMNQARYFLPHLLSLSTSSPFWQGHDTGLKSYRLAVWREMPRTGIPEHFQSYGEFEQQLQALIDAGVIEDGTKLWWDLRPSHRFPTLEMRISDVCTRLDDAISVAGLFACILRMLWRLRRQNQTWRPYRNLLIEENRWRAQRYGTDEGLVDFGKGAIVPYADLLEEMIALVREDAERLDCIAEVAATRAILQRGTSAHAQVAAYNAALGLGADTKEALVQVVDGLVASFTEDL